MKVTLINIDLAKNIFQVCGVNQAGKQVFNVVVKRNKLIEFMAQYPGIPVAMEACSGSNHWGRVFQSQGREVKLIPPKHVKPFVKGNKNDRNDAFAISEAARRPKMNFVAPRTLEQTDMILAHRLRDREKRERTGLTNQLRGLLCEYGIVAAQGHRALRETILESLESSESGMTDLARKYFHQQLEKWCALDRSINQLDKDIRQQCRASEQAKRLTSIHGVAEITATAAVSFAGNAKSYTSGRHFAACLGVVPKEDSSGGKQKLGPITKRGNKYLRRLLVQGAWSVIRHMDTNDDKLSLFARNVVERRGKKIAVVAVANKMARIIWAMLRYQTEYRPA